MQIKSCPQNKKNNESIDETSKLTLKELNQQSVHTNFPDQIKLKPTSSKTLWKIEAITYCNF